MKRSKTAVYLPSRLGEKITWLIQFNNAAQTLKDKLKQSLTTANLQRLNGYRQRVPEVYAYHLNLENYAKTVTAALHLMLEGDPTKMVSIPAPKGVGPEATLDTYEGCFTWLTKTLVPQLLADPGWKDNWMADFGLNPIEETPDSGEPKPEYRAEIKNGLLTVDMRKKAPFESFLLRVDHCTGRWDYERVVMHFPWQDDTPLPTDHTEVWRVQLVGQRNDKQHGQPGDIIDVAARVSVSEHSQDAAK